MLGKNNINGAIMEQKTKEKVKKIHERKKKTTKHELQKHKRCASIDGKFKGSQNQQNVDTYYCTGGREG